MSAPRAALVDAARWRLAGLLFRRPRAGWRDQLEALSSEVGDARLAEAVAAAGDATEGVYLGWCGPGGPVSPREVSYRPLEDPGRLLAEISAFHRAFAYRSDEDEPRDHVAVAADFAGYLTLKEAFAVATGREEAASTTRAARERFVARHVAPLARGMTRRLERAGEAPAWLAAAATALGALAGAGTGQPGDDGADDDAAFPRPGLDRGFPGCAVFEDEDGTFACDAGCRAASGEIASPPRNRGGKTGPRN